MDVKRGPLFPVVNCARSPYFIGISCWSSGAETGVCCKITDLLLASRAGDEGLHRAISRRRQAAVGESGNNSGGRAFPRLLGVEHPPRGKSFGAARRIGGSTAIRRAVR